MHLGRRSRLQLGTRWRTTDGRRGDGDGGPGLDLGGAGGARREEGKVGEQTGAAKERRDIGALTGTSVLPLTSFLLGHQSIPSHHRMFGRKTFQHSIQSTSGRRITPPPRRPASPHRFDEARYHGVTPSQKLGGRARRYPTFHTDGLPDDDPTKQHLAGRAEPDSPVFFRCSSGGLLKVDTNEPARPTAWSRGRGSTDEQPHQEFSTARFHWPGVERLGG